MALHHLGLVFFEAEVNIDTAVSLNERALTIGRRIGDRRFSGNVLFALARISRAHSSITVARSSRCRSVSSQSGSQSEPSPQKGSPAQLFSCRSLT